MRAALVGLFFAWGFALHAMGLLLHEMGGHALASWIFACGIDGYKLTFFGHGQVHYARCSRWTDRTILIADLAGLAVTIGAGLVAAAASRKRSLAPFVRLLLAMLALGFLLGQLAYATSGGFHRLYDPGRLATLLEERGLGWLAWGPSLVAFALSAYVLARVFVDAFREQLGIGDRRRTIVVLAQTLIPAGILYWLAFRIERSLRVDVAMRGVAIEAERLATVEQRAPPFPMERLLIAIAVVAFVTALVRPVAVRADPRPIRRSERRIVLGAGAVFAVILTLLNVFAGSGCAGPGMR
jgi:hypothetical protein